MYVWTVVYEPGCSSFVQGSEPYLTGVATFCDEAVIQSHKLLEDLQEPYEIISVTRGEELDFH